ncbi:MAG: DUF3536 domain-containing protein, partial [Thermodesulfobacteriota bacterium]|nr:DUF3536 domain-containing protein [Thermodesulfobacteriota bacterium]
MTEKFLCIHGHFYQPPRENPWLDFVEVQPSARPYHDWNARVTRECYAPNIRARLLGQDERIIKLVNNYEHMSFDFGPTLLSWLERTSPWTYAQIISADRASRAKHSGHGNALAQVYNHIIMPLACRRDKLTQIRWGLADFKGRFGRPAEGMWLAETAVDSETLRLMAGEGVKFTILSPDQAREVRPRRAGGSAGPWQDVTGGRIDPRRPYRVYFKGPDLGFIDIFFYDGPVSRAIAYEQLLASGSGFLDRIEQAFGDENGEPRLANLATDGESYGHHFKFGEMALAWVFDHVKKNSGPKLTNYAAYLERFPPEYEVEIIENSSWSCAHGVERWRSDCGCSVTNREGWTQAWRAPLREGLDWLAGELASIFEERGARLFKDPWAARDDYISVMSAPGPETREIFIQQHAARTLDPEQISEALCLLESQVMSLFMFTSCGWFFDDISGIETAQDLMYAARGMELVRPWSEKDLEAGLLDFLSRAKSNDPNYKDGADVYHQYIASARMDPSRVAAHFALGRVVSETGFEDYQVFNLAGPAKQRRLSAPNLTVLFGETRIEDERTAQTWSRSYMALHEGGAGLDCLVGEVSGLDLNDLTREIHPALEESSAGRIRDIFARRMGQGVAFGLADLIPDFRNRLVHILALEIHKGFMDWIREFYNSHLDVLSLLEGTGEPVPEMQ